RICLMRAASWLTVCLMALMATDTSHARDAGLSVSAGDEAKIYSAHELLARQDAVTITIPGDVSYKRAMTYRAVPLLALLGDAQGASDTLEVRADDGFVSQIPFALVREG